MLSFWGVLAAQPFEEPTEDDLFVWLSEQWWTPWVMFTITFAICFWMLRSLLHHRGRGRQMALAAEANGMSHREQDGFGLSRVSFHHMARGDGRGWTASHVVTMTAKDGATVHGFDVRSWTEMAISENENGEKTVRRRRIGTGSITDRIVRKHHGKTNTAAMAPLPINAPRLVIARENIVSKVFAAATRIDLDVESEFFNRNYHVIGEDRAFAQAVLDAQMVDLMVSTEGKITFEFLGTWLLLHTEQIEPELVPALVRLADEMRRVVPRLVRDRWGSVPGDVPAR
ncbi:MAG: hypothetical protein AAF548_15120 [Actinomycetota bacterium]